MGETVDEGGRATAPTFLSLLEVHERLDVLFHEHQEALLLLEPERAREILEAFERELVAHMRFEEDVLFPIYARAGPIAGGGGDLYLNEHAKLLRFVARIGEGLGALRLDEPGAARRVNRQPWGDTPPRSGALPQRRAARSRHRRTGRSSEGMHHRGCLRPVVAG